MTNAILIIMILASGGMMKIEAEFDTMNDCQTTAAILNVVPGITSAECVPVKTEGEATDYSVEQGV